MVNHSTPGMRHFHKRRRILVTRKEYPHQDRLKRFIDKTIYFVVGFGILMTIPQITKIWVERTASGVSEISWIAYTISASFWLVYGIVHKDKPIIITNSIWIMLDILIIVGVVFYG